MKHVKKFENIKDLPSYDENQIVKLSEVEEVLVDSLQSGEIDMIHVSIDRLMQRIAEYPKHSKTIKKYNLR